MTKPYVFEKLPIKRDVAINLAHRLTILDHQTQAKTKLSLNAEQLIVLDNIIKHDLVIILKSRGTGISTIVCLMDLMHALIYTGHAVALVAHQEKLSIKLLQTIKQWCHELNIPIKVNQQKMIMLDNGSEIHAITARSNSATGDSTVGRGTHYGRVHLSEFSFYPRDVDVMSAISDALLVGGSIVIESTAAAGDTLFKRIWEGRDADGVVQPGAEDWHRIWLPFEMHQAYQHDPEYLSDSEWEMAQKEGFTSRSHAAYWYLKLRTKKDNNIHLMRRENPQTQEAAFSTAQGKWITKFTAATPRVEGSWRFYSNPDPQDKPIFGIDVAHGVGGDHSALAIISHKTGKLLATWVNNTTPLPALEQVIIGAATLWEPSKICIETNGGQALGALVAVNVAKHKHNGANLQVQHCFAHNSEKSHRMDFVRHAIESGQILAGPELQIEIGSSIVDYKGVYHGRDDLINALGHALIWRKNNPLMPVVTAPDRRNVYVPGATNVKRMR